MGWKIAVVFGVLSWAVTGTGATEEENAFTIDSRLLNRIYEDAAGEPGTRLPQATLEMSPTVSLFLPSQLTLNNEYFTVPYASNVSSLPVFSLAIGQRMAGWDSVQIRGELSVGYGYVEGLYQVRNLSGSDRQSLIRLHRLPLLAMARTTITYFSRVRPFLALGGGAQWFYQDGALDGLSRGFWVPQVRVQPGVQFLLGASDSFFQGLTVGASWEKGLTSAQQLEGWSLDASVDFVL